LTRLPPRCHGPRFFDREETIIRYLTAVSSERETHLTANGALTLCGRAITHTWHRSGRPDDGVCTGCREEAAASGPAHVVPPAERATDLANPAVPA
jgi:hypothetical protein